MRQKRFLPISLLTVLVLMLSAIGVNAQSKAEPITLWTKFNDQSPQNSQDEWLAKALADYTAKTGNSVTNVFKPFDQINSNLNVAVQAKGDVPDLSYVDTQNIPFFVKNGVLTDLTDYVKGTSWFKDLDAGALAACTGSDGKIYCVPTSIAGVATYYWKDFYPNGFPATAQDLLAAAKDLKAKKADKFAVTLKGSEGISLQMTWFPLIISAGGTIADPATGKATWANDKTVEVVKWARELFGNQYAPTVDLNTGFDDETPFMQGDAGAFLAGSWSYVYLNPLTAPDGTKFDNKSESVQKAFDAGKLGFAPPLSWKGNKPVMMITGTAYGIPKGAKNVDGAKAFIDYSLGTDANATYAVAYGALPALKSSLTDKALQTPYWIAIAKNQQQYAANPPALTDYDKGIAALTDTINKLIVQPDLDIMKELQATQDNYNAGLK